jgi:hypothetical protein
MITDTFTNGDPFVCSEDDCKFDWNRQPNGEYFRCAICGHKFKPGDCVRWVYTNYPGSPIPGNPFVCNTCAPTKEDAISILTMMKEHAKTQTKTLWWFFRRNRDHA